MTESDLWKALNANLRAIGGFGTRLESGATGLGIPDSMVQHKGYGFYEPARAAWVELKVAPGAQIPNVEGPQAGFGLRAEAAGIRAVVLAWKGQGKVAIYPLHGFSDWCIGAGDPPPPEWEGPMGACAVSALLHPSSETLPASKG